MIGKNNANTIYPTLIKQPNNNMTYVGFYEMEVTNVHGKIDIMTIRLPKKPSIIQRAAARVFLNMKWYDKIMEMHPSERAQRVKTGRKPKV